MKITASKLLEILKPIKGLADEAKLVLDKDGLTVNIVDPAHIAMVSMKVSKGAFDEYGDVEGEIGIKVKDTVDAVSLSKDVIDIQIKDGRMVLSFGRAKREIALLDGSQMTTPKMPPLSPKNTLTVKTADVRLATKIAKSISDLVTLGIDADGFSIASSTESGSGEVSIGKDELVAHECVEAGKASYSMDYFSELTGAAAGETLTISFHENYPMIAGWQICEGHGDVKYLIAPRIEAD